MAKKYNKKTKKPKVTKAVKKYVKTQTRKLGEIKHINSSSSIAPIFSSIAAIRLSGMAEGTGFGQRIGEKITPRNLTFNFTLYRGLTDCHVRLIIFRWLEQTSVSGTNSILESGNDGTANYINAMYKLLPQDRRRFNILYDRSFLLDDAKQNGLKRSIKLNLLKGKNIFFDGTTATSNARNPIQFVVLSDVALSNAPTMLYHYAFRYHDV